MKARYSNVPITTVRTVKRGDDITAEWAVSISRAIKELRDRKIIITGQNSRKSTPTATTTCPFGSLYNDEEGNIKLKGGVIIGGATTHVEPDIKVADVDPVPGNPPTVIGAEGDVLVLTITYTANNQDNVLIPGVENIVSVSVDVVSEVPDAQLPTIANPQGIIYQLLGTFTITSFIPHSCGNIRLSHCPGSAWIIRN